MKTMTMLAIGLSAVVASSALAVQPSEKTAKVEKVAKVDKVPAADKTAKGANPEQMTCEEFLSLEEVVKPKVVYWAQGVNRKGKVEDATFDVETTDRLVPVIIEVCEKEPKASFWKKMKAEFKKVF